MDNIPNKQVTCPHCGYRMPIFIAENSESKGTTVTCKNKICKKRFEIIVKAGKQVI